MLQEPAPQTVDIGTGFAMGLGTGIGHAVVFAMSVLLSAPAIATMLLLSLGARWPTLGRSVAANSIGGVAVTSLAIVALTVALVPINNMLTQYSTFYEALLVSAAALVVLALFLQIRARASFSWGRATGIATAIATPFVLVLLRNAA